MSPAVEKPDKAVHPSAKLKLVEPGPRRIIDKKWIRARLEQHNLNQTSLATKLGLVRSVVSKMLSGKTAVSVERVADIAALLHVSTDELAARLGAEVVSMAVGKVEIVGRVIDGMVKRQKDGFAPTCAGADQDTRAIRNYTHGALYGSIYYFQEAQGVAVDAIGRQCLAKTKGGAEMIRIVENSMKPGTFDLIDFDGSRQSGIQLESATRIKWTMGSI